MAKAILLAEDSPDDEFLFRRVLQENHIHNPVQVVRDGVEAIAYLTGEGEFADRAKYPRPEILFVDVRMPRADGFAVLEWLNANPKIRAGLLIIVLTQFGDSNQIRRAYELGAQSFLPKPFTREESENLIRHFSSYWLRAGAEGT